MPVNKINFPKPFDKAEDAEAEAVENKFQTDWSFLDALVKYNESLCHAEAGSESVGLAFANRSAVYFEMKLFEKCLNNIEHAKSNNYPEKNYSVLGARCKEMTSTSANDDENPFEFIKLSHKSNSKLPFVANCMLNQRWSPTAMI